METPKGVTTMAVRPFFVSFKRLLWPFDQHKTPKLGTLPRGQSVDQCTAFLPDLWRTSSLPGFRKGI